MTSLTTKQLAALQYLFSTAEADIFDRQSVLSTAVNQAEYIGQRNAVISARQSLQKEQANFNKTVDSILEDAVAQDTNIETTELDELVASRGYESALIVEIDAQQLTTKNISLSAVANVLKQSQSRVISLGVHNESYVTELVFDGVVTTPETVGNLMINDGVKVRDVAKVYLGARDNRPYIFYQNQEKRGEIVMLALAKVEGASAPVVTKNIFSEIDEKFKQPEFSALTYKVVGDYGVTAEKEIFGLTKNLVTSIIIVALVLFLFLSA